MLKKTTILAAMACMLTAFAIPTVAQADKLVREGPMGSKIPLSVTSPLDVTAPGGWVYQSAWGSFACQQVGISGELVSNGPSVQIKSKNTTLSTCSPDVLNEEMGQITLEGGKGSATLSYNWGSPTGCKYSGTISFAYEYGSNVLKVVPYARLQGPPACGEHDYAGFNNTLEMKEPNGTPVYIIK